MEQQVVVSESFAAVMRAAVDMLKLADEAKTAAVRKAALSFVDSLERSEFGEVFGERKPAELVQIKGGKGEPKPL